MMRRIIQACIVVIGSIVILALGRYVSAQQWERVATRGFGEPSNDYAWSMKAFQGKLYVGTFNLTKGGEIWCTATGNAGSWKKVYDGRPGTNMGIRNLYSEDDKVLYACTVSASGADVLITTNGQKWVSVGRKASNRNAPAFRCMARFGEYLYMGAGSKGAQLYRSKDGSNWIQVKTNPDFQETRVYDPDTGSMVVNNTMIGELTVFNNQLYAFTWSREIKYRDIVERMLGQDIDLPRVQSVSPPGAFEVWRSKDGVNWEKVVGQNDAYGNGMGFCLLDSQGMDNDAVSSAMVFKGQLYLGTVNDNACSTIWRTADGTQWTKVLDFFGLGERANYYVWRMIQFQDKLFIGTMNVGPITAPGVTGAQIWASESGDAGTFYNVVHNGFDGETWSCDSDVEIPKNIGIRTLAIFKGSLFAGTATVPSIPIPNRGNDSKGRRIVAGDTVGCEVWRMVP